MSYDVIVVGARAAGTSLAALLAQAGMRVLLLERVTFPKPTLSCPLYFGNTFYLLNRIGAMGKVDAMGAPKLMRYQVAIRDVRLSGRMLPYNGFDYAYHIRREQFDDMLFNHVAAMQNVEARQGVHVTGLLQEKERVVGVRAREGGGKEFELRADAVVGADGFFSAVAEHAQAERYQVIPPRTCVYYAYYTNVRFAGEEPTATLYYDPDDKFAFITANTADDLTVVSMSLPATKFEWARARHESLHLDFAERIPEMAERMANAERVSPVYGVSPRPSFYRQAFGKGWALVGDAGFYKDPLPGQGLYDALRSTELAARAFVEYRDNGGSPEAWETAFQKYHKTRDRETRAMYELTDYLADLERERSAQTMAYFRAIAAMPDWSDRYVSLFNGVTPVEWFVRPDTYLRIFAEWGWRGLTKRIFSFHNSF